MSNQFLRSKTQLCQTCTSLYSKLVGIYMVSTGKLVDLFLVFLVSPCTQQSRVIQNSALAQRHICASEESGYSWRVGTPLEGCHSGQHQLGGAGH